MCVLPIGGKAEQTCLGLVPISPYSQEKAQAKEMYDGYQYQFHADRARGRRP